MNTAEASIANDVVPLSFSELNRRLTALPDIDRSRSRHPRWAAWGPAAVMIGGSAACCAQYLPIPILPRLTLIGLCVLAEVIGLIVSIRYGAPGEIRNFFSPRQGFAATLDFELPHHLALVDWLLAQPPAELKKHRDYSKFRRERMSQKLPIVIGNIQMLGILPLALAVFLQIHQLTSSHPISPIEMIAALFLAAVYLGSWNATLLKQRFDAMDMLLELAMTEAEAATAKPA